MSESQGEIDSTAERIVETEQVQTDVWRVNDERPSAIVAQYQKQNLDSRDISLFC